LRKDGFFYLSSGEFATGKTTTDDFMDIQDDSYFNYDYTHSRKAKMMAIGVIKERPVKCRRITCFSAPLIYLKC